MLKIYQSNNTNLLIDKTCDIIKKYSSNNAFIKENFIVQNNQLQEWIKYRIAKKNGILANVEFFTFKNFILKILNYNKKDKSYKYDNFSYYLTWEIMNIAEYKNISYFIKKKDNQTKKMIFSTYMAKLFNQYSYYQPNWNHDLKKNKKKIFLINKNGKLHFGKIAYKT
ncbi:exodeoxyribonuclease V subunit gamma [Buchnera aphidicola]|uniref:exodeoxyribonuclease V subunit gamma n=1 Tax=Buchnera aphidicola TaxID=9 RepID=UPI003463A488